MKRIQLDGGNYLIKYNKAEELIIKRYSKFQKYLLYKTGVGSDIESVGIHFQNLFGFLAHEKNAEAKKEAENLYYNFFAILQEIDYEDLAFACLVYSVNGEPKNDLSEESLQQLIDELSDFGMTKEMVSTEVDDTRMNILKDLKMYFPKFFPESDNHTIFAKKKQQLMATADAILQDIENDGVVDDKLLKLLQEISLFFVEQRKPKNFASDDTTNAVVKMDAQFETLCSMVEANGASNSKEFTLIEFYSRLEFIRKSNLAASGKA